MKNWVFIAGSFLLGVCAGYFIGVKFTPSETKRNETTGINKLAETRNAFGYKFINPLLECDNFAPSEIASYAVIKSKLSKYIANAKVTEQVTHISVYYRDLNNGPWIGLGEQDPFSPASMLKVPIMMAVLKFAESESDLLKRKYEVTAADVDDFAPNIDDQMVKVGENHSVQEFIERMIVYSDNTAKNVLLRILQTSTVNSQLWVSLGLAEPSATTPSDFLSVKDYSSFFRILYNATYLTKEHS